MSIEADIVGVADDLGQILWTTYFLNKQRYNVNETMLYQDNTSTELLEKNIKYPVANKLDMPQLYTSFSRIFMKRWNKLQAM